MKRYRLIEFAIIIMLSPTTHFGQDIVELNSNHSKWAVEYTRHSTSDPKLRSVFFIQESPTVRYRVMLSELDLLPELIIKYDFERKIVVRGLFFDTRMIAFRDTSSLSTYIRSDSEYKYCDLKDKEIFCDSIYTLNADGDILYKMYFDNTLPNIHSSYLWDPRINYLPYKILRDDTVWLIKEIVYDTNRIDALIASMINQDFMEWTEEDLDRDLRLSQGMSLEDLDEIIKELIEKKRQEKNSP